jgi:hypothetical protein
VLPTGTVARHRERTETEQIAEARCKLYYLLATALIRLITSFNLLLRFEVQTQQCMISAEPQ